MGKIADDNRSVSTILPKDTVAIIDARRNGQSMTRSKYVSLIIQRWMSDGCKPVNEADHAVQILSGKGRKAG